jgi:ribonuclease HIII
VSDTPANGVPDDLKRFLEEAGVQISFSRHIDYGDQYRVTRAPDIATLNVYTSGRISTGGKPSGLLTLLENWRLARVNADERGSRGFANSTEPDETPRVGTDEAGKGDYFGPLVVAGVRVLDEEVARKLREIGARDSKTLSVLGAVNLAPRIVELVGLENVRVVVLHPREYEARRRASGDNVNKLLAKVNVQIFNELKDKAELFVVDEFAKAAPSYIGPQVPSGVRLVIRPGAEDDVAVATASILARSRYLEEMGALSEGVGFELPRGAAHVLEAARRVVKERGLEGLADVAKVHFGTTARVLGEEAGG